MNCVRGEGSEMSLAIFPKGACTKQDLTLLLYTKTFLQQRSHRLNGRQPAYPGASRVSIASKMRIADCQMQMGEVANGSFSHVQGRASTYQVLMSIPSESEHLWRGSRDLSFDSNGLDLG